MKHTHFIVMLAATLLFCSCEAKQKENAREKAIAEKQVDFTCTANGLNVQFTDKTSGVGGGVTSRVWDYGDGITSPDGRTDKIVHMHTYTAVGTYDVTLTITWIADICGKPEYISKSCTKQIIAGSADIKGFSVQNLGSKEGYVRFEMLGYVGDSVAFGIITDYSSLLLTSDLLPDTTLLSSPRSVKDFNPYTRFAFNLYCAKDKNDYGTPVVKETITSMEILTCEGDLTFTDDESGASAFVILSHD